VVKKGKTENLKSYKKGETGNPNGRPRKFVTTLKEQGYKLSEINDTIRVIYAMTEKELIEVKENPESTVLEKLIASAALKGVQEGETRQFDSFVARAFGKPNQSIDISDSTDPRLVSIKQAIQANAERKSISYEAELKNYLEHYALPDIKEKLVSELEN
jgi:hypothetical protein